jgi:hypothetical protein
MPLFRTEPEEDGLPAINIALLRSGTPDILLFAFSLLQVALNLIGHPVPATSQLEALLDCLCVANIGLVHEHDVSKAFLSSSLHHKCKHRLQLLKFVTLECLQVLRQVIPRSVEAIEVEAVVAANDQSEFQTQLTQSPPLQVGASSCGTAVRIYCRTCDCSMVASAIE